MIMGILALVLAAGGLIGGVAWAVQRAQQDRIAGLRATATRLGWGFRDDVPFETIPTSSGSSCSGRGARRS
jgi:hypothetical protein